MRFRSIYKAATQVRILLNHFLHVCGLVALGEDCVELILDQRRLTHCLNPFLPAERILPYYIPEAGVVKKSGDSVGLVVLKPGYHVRGYSYLQAVEVRARSNVIESVRNQVFASARRPRRTGDFHRNAIQHQSRGKQLDAIEIPCWFAYELVHSSVGH